MVDSHPSMPRTTHRVHGYTTTKGGIPRSLDHLGHPRRDTTCGSQTLIASSLDNIPLLPKDLDSILYRVRHDKY